ncbi:hypothetical protein [Streptomyces sp. DSM 41534]
MSRFIGKTNKEVLTEGSNALLASHEARTAGNTGEAQRQEQRYEETAQEMRGRYAAENADPEAALLIRRAFDA